MADSNELSLPSLQKLQSSAQLELFNVVDSLRACGLSEIVNLPQLIVCGDQSSGKSSVLEGISGIPFPRQDVLCTRFATEVILRKAAKDEITVSIIPGENTSSNIENLKRFRRDLRTKKDFEILFETAREAMGLSASKSFSNDVLRVELCGPTQPQLTLVDLPGLIHTETKSQNASDVSLVHKLVSGYLKNPQSIILAVVSAKNDIGNQIILRKAREVDPHGLRTLGIITKPDLLPQGSKGKEAFIALARNEDVNFSLGWHVVKNLDFAIQPVDDGARDEKEKQFFQDSGFNCLPARAVGIDFLRSRLSKVLFDQIRTELPRLMNDIQSHISAAKRDQDKLGQGRETTEDQRRFLITLSQSFQTICRDAARGHYEHEFFQEDANPERRLCANIMNMHFDFAKNLRQNGAYWLVEKGNTKDHKYRTRKEAIKEACLLLRRSRGRELPGQSNPLLVGELFREYSRPWGDLARHHIKNVWEATNRFLDLLLRHLADADTCENVFRYWLQPTMEEKLNLSFRKLDELLDVHKDYPMTTNSLFLNRSSKKPSNTDLDLDLSDDEDMDMVAAEDALDNMDAYYEVAINLFADNVPALAIQAPIIREIPNLFCPTAVFSMGTDTVEQIAKETEETIEERKTTARRQKILEDGAFICRRYARRPQTSAGISSQDAKTAKSSPTIPASKSNMFSESPPKEEGSHNLFARFSNPAQPDLPSGGNLQKTARSTNGTSSASQKSPSHFVMNNARGNPSGSSPGTLFAEKPTSGVFGFSSTQKAASDSGNAGIQTPKTDSTTTTSGFASKSGGSLFGGFGGSSSNSTTTSSVFGTTSTSKPNAFGSS